MTSYLTGPPSSGLSQFLIILGAALAALSPYLFSLPVAGFTIVMGVIGLHLLMKHLSVKNVGAGWRPRHTTISAPALRATSIGDNTIFGARGLLHRLGRPYTGSRRHVLAGAS